MLNYPYFDKINAKILTDISFSLERFLSDKTITKHFPSYVIHHEEHDVIDKVWLYYITIYIKSIYVLNQPCNS